MADRAARASEARSAPTRGDRGTFAGAVAKFVLALGLGLLAVSLGLSLLALGAIHTDWGRDKARAAGERVLGAFVHGEVEIGELSGSLLSRFDVHRVAIRDPGGDAVIAIRRVSIDYAPSRLLRRELRLEDAHIDRLAADVRIDEEGRVNVAEILDIPEPDPDVPPWRIRAERFAASDSAAEVRALGEELASIAEIELFARADIRWPEELSLWLGRFSAQLSRPGARDLPISARGGFTHRHEHFRARDLAIFAGEGSSLSAPHLEGELRGPVRGAIAARALAGDVRRLAPDLPLAGDLELEGRVFRARDHAPVRASLQGQTAEAPTRTRARLWPGERRGTLDVDVRDLDPQNAIAGAPPGSLDVDTEASFRGGGESPTAALDLSSRGKVAEHRLDRAELRARAREGTVRARGLVEGPAGNARARLRLALGGDAPALKRGELSFAIDDLAELAGEDAEAAGRARGRARAEGELGDLDLRAELTADELRVRETGARRVTAEASFANFARAPSGRARVEIRDIAAAGERVSNAVASLDLRDGRRGRLELSAGQSGEPYAAEGRVEFEARDGAARARVPSLWVRTRELVWRAGETAFRLSPERGVAIDRFQLSSDAGRLAAEGHVQGADAGAITLRADDFDLARVRRALRPDAPPVEGVADLRADARWDPARGHLRGRVEDLTMPIVAAIDLDFDLRVAEEDVGLTLGTLGEDAELVEVHVEAETPEPIFQIDDWEAIGLDAIERLALEVADIELLDRP